MVAPGGACMVALRGWGACMVLFGGMLGFIWGVCMVLFGGHEWFYLGGHAWFYSGVCMVLFGGCAWFYSGGMRGFIRGGMHGFIWGPCVVLFSRGGMRGFFSFFGYNEIRSMSGRYASYWHAFLVSLIFVAVQCEHQIEFHMNPSGSDIAFTNP